jgi:hypothetical protein
MLLEVMAGQAELVETAALAVREDKKHVHTAVETVIPAPTVQLVQLEVQAQKAKMALKVIFLLHHFLHNSSNQSLGLSDVMM